MKGQALVMGDDGGGWRQYLDGKPIHCGATLELEEIAWRSRKDDFGEVVEWVESTGNWIAVRYELNWRRRGEKTERVPIMCKRISTYEFTCEIHENHRFRWPGGDS